MVIKDQIEKCKKCAQIERASQITTLSDHPMSGNTPLTERLGGRALLSAIKLQAVDLIIIENFERLSRNSIELETIIRQIELQNISLICITGSQNEGSYLRSLLK